MLSKDTHKLSLEQKNQYIEILSKKVTPNRWAQIQTISSQRTRHVSMVLEDIYQGHNAAAVLRSCEAMGIQDIHVIEKGNKLNLTQSTVSKGAVKWLELMYYNNTSNCYKHLREQGYRIAATAFTKDGIDIEELTLDQPLAIVLGNELHGMSTDGIQEADICIHLPMRGFVQSYNLSVCGALCINSLTKRLRESNINWQLNDEEITNLRLQWLTKCVKGWDRWIQKIT